MNRARFEVVVGFLAAIGAAMIAIIKLGV